MNKLIIIKYNSNNGNVVKECVNNTYRFFEAYNAYGYKKQGFEHLELEVKGKSYKEKQNNLRELAIDFQNFNSLSCDVDLSQGETATICNWFESKAKLFGLTKEFKENAII